MERLDEIFNLRYGHSLELNKLTQVEAPNGLNFVSRTMTNNGVSARVLSNAVPGEPGEITVALSGNVLASFVQPEAFVTSYHVMILSPKDPTMSLETKLWYCACIWENRYRYSYGRQANRTLGSLLVPEKLPNWVGSKKVPSHEGLQRSLSPRKKLTDVESWSDFPLKDIFEIKKGKRVTKAHRQPGSTAFIGASESNNGITDWNSLAPIFPAGTLSVPYNGSVGFAFYQDRPFFASDDIHVLIPKVRLSRWAMLFIVTMIRHEKDRFTYGYKWNLSRMGKTTLRLPTAISGEPDWTYMERYMQGLPFSAALLARADD
ncbi:restriction endonuclease subunit S [Corynebacterium tuberculostearicum]|uniref:restriction endonuclease subunit S n=1 Tax=Corynebacterium tuberculostearicum TaxID=38304 RepID=UPI0026494843|nr:restriction endonuclease subunit S [Corynebacterium tuberculostearicum]WKE60686.1 restriction endonuclease subunit S [Corynebacterium tuberculostearicum]